MKISELPQLIWKTLKYCVILALVYNLFIQDEPEGRYIAAFNDEGTDGLIIEFLDGYAEFDVFLWKEGEQTKVRDNQFYFMLGELFISDWTLSGFFEKNDFEEIKIQASHFSKYVREEDHKKYLIFYKVKDEDPTANL